MITTAEKKQLMRQLSDENQIISALAIDQRGALKKMIQTYQETEPAEVQIKTFKEIVSSELTPYASAILLDPEYGLPAAETRDKNAGLLLAYEQTGYDVSVPGRLPDLLPTWSVKRLKEKQADACKFLLYYDVDESEQINEQKKVFIERIGSECQAENLPFFLELLSYDAKGAENNSKEYAAMKPRKVIQMMEEFSNERYGVDVLKVEVPVNMAYVEGYSEEAVYTKEKAAGFFKKQAEITQLPYIFLSAGVPADFFRETVRFAKEAGSTFNGVLCGRATWADGVAVFVKEGEEAARAWMRSQGRKNIEELNDLLKETAEPLTI